MTDDPKDVPSWGGENITDDGFITLENQRFISREYFRVNGKGRVQVGDILVNKDGANTGKLAFVDSLPVEEVSVNEHVFIIRNKGEFDQRFLFEFLCSYLGQKQVKALIIGSAQPGLNTRFTKHVLLPKPEIDEQRNIGRLFVEIDSAIAAVRESISKAERLQKGMMQQLLTGRLKLDGKPRDESDFDTDERLGLFPRGWKVRKLRQVVRLRNGKSNVTSNLQAKADAMFCYPVFGGNGMTGWSNRYLLENPTVVLGRVGEYCGVVHRTPPKAWVTDNALYASEFPEPIDVGFLFYLLTHLRLNRWKAITGQPKITQSEILNIRVAIPEDTTEQTEIAVKLDGLRHHIEAKQTKIAVLQRLKKSLMQNLLTGRIRLPLDGAAKEATR